MVEWLRALDSRNYALVRLLRVLQFLQFVTSATFAMFCHTMTKVSAVSACLFTIQLILWQFRPLFHIVIDDCLIKEGQSEGLASRTFFVWLFSYLFRTVSRTRKKYSAVFQKVMFRDSITFWDSEHFVGRSVFRSTLFLRLLPLLLQPYHTTGTVVVEKRYKR